MMDFQPWPKTPRLFKDCTITEKIDGTNAAIIVEQFGNDMNHPDLFERYSDPGEPGLTTVTNFANERYQAALVGIDTNLYLVGAQSRNRLIHPTKDNAGFARWVFENAEELATVLGVGRHFGEWWGQGIQRNYGMTSKRFSLFNVHRYAGPLIGSSIDNPDGLAGTSALDTVPILYQGPFVTAAVTQTLEILRNEGSKAAPGFDRPEGVVVYHSASKQVYKAFVDAEDEAAPKGARETKSDYVLAAPKGARG